ncbi:MAG: Ig-like domain-containing protein [Planctomycetota bacterium]|nr:Ig-like domain-containing protein [Planctomycetota bacterium]
MQRPHVQALRARKAFGLVGLLGLAALTGCRDNDLAATPHSTAVTLTYSPSLGAIPLPNDLLFSGTVDATLNFPDPTDAAQQPLFDALNSLDGFSTTAPLSFAFESAVDNATVVAGSTVRLFEVDTAVSGTTGLKIGTPVVDVIAELSTPAEYVVAPTSTPGSFAIVPTQPLDPATAYMVVVTNGITDDDGEPVTFSTEYGLARVPASEIQYPDDHPFFALQGLVNAMEDVASTDADVSPAIAIDDIVVSFQFTTQGIGSVLGVTQLVADGAEAAVLGSIAAAFPGHPAGSDAPINQVPTATVNTTTLVVPSPGGLADLYTGELTLPYYLTAAANATPGTVVTDDLPLTEYWHARYTFPFGVDTEANISSYNPLPVQSAAETIPMLISMPDPVATGLVKPAGGWPVVLYQHGITSDRSSMLGLADKLAASGYACVAIDLPLHGITEVGNDPLGGLLFAGYQDGAVRERTFGLDNVTQVGSATTAATPDGNPDTSGAHFINLTSLRTQRDNLRQAAADLFALRAVIAGGLDVDGGADVDLDTANAHFLGMSLGAIVGTPYSALDGSLVSTVLNVPGGGIPRMLEASPAYGPIVVGGLLAAGIAQGTPEFDQFMWAAQTVIDTGDPINYCTTLAASGTPVLLQEVVGDGTVDDLFGLPDQVIPNSVTGAPLSGTEPMATMLGLTNVPTGVVATSLGAVRFSQGGHSSLLTATPDIDGDGTGEVDGSLTAANAEMQNEIVDWLDDAGTQVTITDDTVIQ